MASDLVKAMFAGQKLPTESATQLPTQSSDPVTRLLEALLQERAPREIREMPRDQAPALLAGKVPVVERSTIVT